MKIIAKFPISTGDGKGGKIVIPKGAEGSAIGVSNSVSIKKAFPELEHKPDGWFYICRFPPYTDEILCDLSQLEIR
jgi:hypothetical protein